MSMFIDYATKRDLAEYMGTDEQSLPKGVDIALKRANELIAIAMRNNYNEKNEKHVEVVKLAVCSQVQNWIETNVSPVSNGNVSSYSLGELSITYSDVDKFSNKLCVTSARYLNSQGLLYKGM